MFHRPVSELGRLEHREIVLYLAEFRLRADEEAEQERERQRAQSGLSPEVLARARAGRGDAAARDPYQPDGVRRPRRTPRR